MRFSKLFGKTLREAPSAITRTAEQLAVRAALMRRVHGLAYFLPLGVQTLSRIVQLTSRTLEHLGGQEASLRPGRFLRNDHLEYKSEISSYRDLPGLLFHPVYPGNFYIDLLETEATYVTSFRNVYEALVQVMQICGLKVSAVEAGVGGTRFVVLEPETNSYILICTSSACGYCALEDLAVFKIPDGIDGEALPLAKVETPHCTTIADLAEFLKIETRQTLKAVLYSTIPEEEKDEVGEFIFVVIRGDLEVSEAKLLKVLNVDYVRPANESEIVAINTIPGYASPVGLRIAKTNKERGQDRVTVVADSSVQIGANFAAGANESGYHFINVNYPRDFQVTILADIAQAQVGSACAQCGEPLRSETVFVVGGCEAVGATELTYLSKDGRPEPVWLGNFWLRPESILLSVIDQHHDEAGIVWPRTIAPYDIHLIRLGKGPETLETADKFYTDLQAAGKTVLYDDRDEASPGVKFADADLIGLPVRVTVSDKGLKAGTVEVKRRDSTEKITVPLAEALDTITKL